MSFRAKLQTRALQTAMNAVGVLAMIALLLASWRDTGYILAAIALAVVIWVSATVSFALTMPAQLLIVVSLLADYEDSVDQLLLHRVAYMCGLQIHMLYGRGQHS